MLPTLAACMAPLQYADTESMSLAHQAVRLRRPARRADGRARRSPIEATGAARSQAAPAVIATAAAAAAAHQRHAALARTWRPGGGHCCGLGWPEGPSCE